MKNKLQILLLFSKRVKPRNFRSIFPTHIL